MQTFLLIVIFILIVINLKQADELRDLERKILDNQRCRAASGRYSGADEQEETQRIESWSAQGDNVFDREQDLKGAAYE